MSTSQPRKQLEKLEGGMGFDDGGPDMGKVIATLCDKEKREKVAAALRDYAERLDQVVKILKTELD